MRLETAIHPMAKIVSCYAGSRYPERPRAFLWEGQWLEVAEVERRWRTPDGPVFRVRSSDGRRFALAYEEAGERNFKMISACPLPTIAAISGACTGGGAGIAAVCDIRIASADLKFGFPIARTLGNTLSAATLSRLVNLVGEAKVVDMIFKSRLVGAEEALQAGLVNEVCEDCDAVMARAFELAEQLKTHAPLTMRSIKTLLRRIRESRPPVEDHDIIAEVYTSADFKEGMDAFLNKRKPNWQGR